MLVELTPTPIFTDILPLLKTPTPGKTPGEVAALLNVSRPRVGHWCVTAGLGTSGQAV